MKLHPFPPIGRILGRSAARLRLPAAAALALALAAGGPAPGAAGAEPNLASWIDGPIRYIARKEEVKTFRKLRKDSDRTLFIDRFWARRDPTPESLSNEYRQIFWERVSGANELFLDSAKPGWKTDRGKIYILYGPPTKIEEDLHVLTEGLAAAGQGLIRWIYEGRPEQRHDLNPIVVVAFVRDAGGEFRVSYDPKLTSIFFDPHTLEDPRQRSIDRFIDAFGAPTRSELSVMLDLGRMQEVPPHAQLLLERVETVESYDTHEVQTLVSRYRHPERDGSVVVITVDVSDTSEKTDPSVIARLAYADDPARAPVVLGEDAFKVATADGVRVAQGRVLLEPARYALTVVVVDPETAATGIERETFDVPPRSADLRLSDMLWAADLTPLPYASLASHDEPFHVGPFRVLPRVDSVFRPGQTLRLFYEVYGGSPPYRVTYTVQGREDDGRWTSLGQPSSSEQDGAAQGWALPTTDVWPSGSYRIHVEVADGADHRVQSDLAFQLEPAEPQDPSN